MARVRQSPEVAETFANAGQLTFKLLGMSVSMCSECGEYFATERYNDSYCSTACRERADRTRNRPKHVRRQTLSVGQGWETLSVLAAGK